MNMDDLLQDATPPYNPAWDTVAVHLAPIKHAPVGSKYTCTAGYGDDDHLFLVADQRAAALSLSKRGWDMSAKDYDGDDFVSLRYCDYNALLTDSPEFYEAFVQAAEVCKALDLSDKTDRVTVHRVILYGEDAKTARANAEQL